MIDITVRGELKGSDLVFNVPEYIAFIKEMLHKRDGMLQLRIDVPIKKKTSPENRLLHALIGQLAMYRETSLELIKRYVKVRACSHGYPYDMIEYEEKDKKRTIVEPKSVADASTVEVALLIETCCMVAGEWQIELRSE